MIIMVMKIMLMIMMMTVTMIINNQSKISQARTSVLATAHTPAPPMFGARVGSPPAAVRAGRRFEPKMVYPPLRAENRGRVGSPPAAAAAAGTHQNSRPPPSMRSFDSAGVDAGATL